MRSMGPRDIAIVVNSDNTNTLNTNANSSSEQIDSLALSGQQQQQTTNNSEQTEPKANNRRYLMKNQIFGYDMPFDVISVAYATAVAVGGIIGYVKAKSTYSLIAGLAFGGLLGFGAYQTSVNPRNYYLTLGTSAVLGAFMGYRAYNSGKFMPAGLVATLSILMVLRFTIRAITESNYVKK